MKHVVFVAVSPVQILDLTGPFEIFARTGGYRVDVASNADDGYVQSSCGLTISGALCYKSIRFPIDTLLVTGGTGAEELACDGQFLEWLASAGMGARRTGSVCTGAFLLAACGLLDGRRAVTHWNYCARLARQFPTVKVEKDPIFIKDGSLYTSAGVTAGLDLALALVEEDHGRQRALAVARDLVMFLRRPGGQSQFSSLLESQAAGRDAISELRAWILGNLKSDLSVAALARRGNMSPRHFARVLKLEKGITPARYVLQVRVEAARILLENGSYPLKEAAAQCGFASADSLRRAFRRVLGVTAGQYVFRWRGDRARQRHPVLHLSTESGKATTHHS
jgi:transcriptional regulator GlxA family with amidase domain